MNGRNNNNYDNDNNILGGKDPGGEVPFLVALVVS